LVRRVICFLFCLWARASAPVQAQSNRETAVADDLDTDRTSTSDQAVTGSPSAALKPRVLAAGASTSAASDWRSYLPPYLLKKGPKGIVRWQWVMLPLLILFAWAVGRALAEITRLLLTPVVSRAAANWSDAILSRLRPPLTASYALAFAYITEPLLELNRKAELLADKILNAWFLALIEKAGTSFAYPTTTVHLVSPLS
jgi:hypothetical protein